MGDMQRGPLGLIDDLRSLRREHMTAAERMQEDRQERLHSMGFAATAVGAGVVALAPWLLGAYVIVRAIVRR